MLLFVKKIDAASAWVARLVARLLPIMMLLVGTVVVLRYVFSSGAIMLQEAVTYLHAIVFMLGIPYTFSVNEHVRVDVLYASFSQAQRDWVNLLGHLLFLLPVSLSILVLSWQYTLNSWIILEGSSEVGGLPAVFLLKSLIPLMAVLLLLQGLSEITKCIMSLNNQQTRPHTT